MGYRLHYAQSYQPNWQGGFLSGGDTNGFAQLVYEEFENNHWINDEESECELERTDIQAYIEKLLKSPDQKNKHITEQTNKQIADMFTQILKSDDDTIHMEWF